MSHDTLLDLSRWQWALTAAFHITFPAVTVGTSVFMVVCHAMYMGTDVMTHIPERDLVEGSDDA